MNDGDLGAGSHGHDYAPRVKPALKYAAADVVQRMATKMPDMQCCVISTEDGFEIATYIRHSGVVTSRLSAMASSMASLGVIVGEENKLGTCCNMTIEAEGGFIVMLHVRRPDVTLVLSVVTTKKTVLGQLLYEAREVVKILEKA